MLPPVTEPLVSVQWLKKNLQNPDLIILDASMKENKAKMKAESEGLQIPGARYFDLQFPAANGSGPSGKFPVPETFSRQCRALGINKNSSIVVYDKLGIYSSPRLWWMFKAMGHDQVAVLDGGLPAWTENGFETEKAVEKKYKTGDFEAHFRTSYITMTGEVTENLHSEKFLLIDARTEGRFKGLAPEPRAGIRSGHIPKSVNLPFSRVLENGRYLPKEALRKIFNDLATGKKPLVFSCGSGVTACILILAAEMATDNPKSLYDGSWTEYAGTENQKIP